MQFYVLYAKNNHLPMEMIKNVRGVCCKLFRDLLLTGYWNYPQMILFPQFYYEKKALDCSYLLMIIYMGIHYVASQDTNVSSLIL